jgi:hypothetical protein
MSEWEARLTSHPEALHNPVVFSPGSIRDAFEYGKEFCIESVVSKRIKRL